MFDTPTVRWRFDLFDAEKTGRIDYHELKVCMRALGFDVKPSPATRAILAQLKAGECIRHSI